MKAGKQWLSCVTEWERDMKMTKAVNYSKKRKYRRKIFPLWCTRPRLGGEWNRVWAQRTERKQNYSWKLEGEAESLEEQKLDCQLTGWKKMWQQVKCKGSTTRELKRIEAKCPETWRKAFQLQRLQRVQGQLYRPGEHSNYWWWAHFFVIQHPNTSLLLQHIWVLLSQEKWGPWYWGLLNTIANEINASIKMGCFLSNNFTHVQKDMMWEVRLDCRSPPSWLRNLWIYSQHMAVSSPPALHNSSHAHIAYMGDKSNTYVSSNCLHHNLHEVNMTEMR